MKKQLFKTLCVFALLVPYGAQAMLAKTMLARSARQIGKGRTSRCPNFKELRKAFVQYLDAEKKLNRDLGNLKAAMKKCSEQSNLVQQHATKVEQINHQRVSHLQKSDDCDSNWTMRGMCGPECVCHCTV